jgi:hypothetical protein
MKFQLKWVDIIVIMGIIFFLAIMLYIANKIDAEVLRCFTNPLNYTMERTGAKCFCVKV